MVGDGSGGNSRSRIGGQQGAGSTVRNIGKVRREEGGC